MGVREVVGGLGGVGRGVRVSARGQLCLPPACQSLLTLFPNLIIILIFTYYKNQTYVDQTCFNLSAPMSSKSGKICLATDISSKHCPAQH